MTDEIILSKEKVRSRQQRMIRALEGGGLYRKNLSAIHELDKSYFNHVMSEAGAFMASAWIHDNLYARVNRMHLFEFVEELLPPGYYIAYAPEGTTNDSYVDELLEGQQALGDATRAVKHLDHLDARAKGESFMEIGRRIIAESAEQLRKKHGASLFG